MIELQHVFYSYEGAPALRDISLAIQPGDAVCLLGPNGSGKSTLLRLLSGLLEPQEGSYRFDGEEVTRKALKNAEFSKRFHQRVGFVFQDSDTQLFCPTVFDEVAFGPRQMGLSEEDVEQRVSDCLALLELTDFRSRQPYHLSGGEKKKVAIAATLALNPEVLILDEPMNGLDPKTTRFMTEFLIQLNRAGKTIITSTHHLSLARRISTRAILFESGHHVAADCSTYDLLANRELLLDVGLLDNGEGPALTQDPSRMEGPSTS